MSRLDLQSFFISEKEDSIYLKISAQMFTLWQLSFKVVYYFLGEATLRIRQHFKSISSLEHFLPSSNIALCRHNSTASWERRCTTDFAAQSPTPEKTNYGRHWATRVSQ